MIFFEFGNFGIKTMVVRLHQSNEKLHIEKDSTAAKLLYNWNRLVL
jgi:hypothetical protein